MLCPCNSGYFYDGCCKPLHEGVLRAKTPLELMRSRYSAFVFDLEDYLLHTWHPSTRPKSLNLSEKNLRWISLEIVSSPPAAKPYGTLPGIVEFIATYETPDLKRHKLHERSHFLFEDETWYYLGKAPLSK